MKVHTCWSKDDDHFPPNAPEFIRWGSGVIVRGSDDREYLDWGMGLRSVILGHGYGPILHSVRDALMIGANHTRPTRYEGELAERLAHFYPIRDPVVKFGKNGSDAVTAAVRLARAFTGYQNVLACADPFHASDDWWLSTQARRAGTVEQGTELFSYNDTERFRITAKYPGAYAAVVIEPMSFEWPSPGYLQMIRRWCDLTGTVLIFDEVITGFRFGMKGGAGYFGVTPDLACFGKAMANGFSVSALIGRRDIMTTPNVHALSSTHGGETHELAAAIATVDELDRQNVPDHIARIGRRLCEGLRAIGYDVRGHPASPTVAFHSEAVHMAFMASMCERGILAPYWAPSYSHTEADVDRTVKAAQEVAAEAPA